MTTTQVVYAGVLRQALDLPHEARLRLLAELQQAELPPAPTHNGLGRGRPDPWPAMEWLRLHSKEYGDCWVALDGNRLIAHGPDAEVVYAAAQADGAYLPLIKFIESVDAPPFVF